MTEKNNFSKTVVISLSGGLDSTSLMLHFLAKKYKVSSIAMTIRLEKLGYCFN